MSQLLQQRPDIGTEDGAAGSSMLTALTNFSLRKKTILASTLAGTLVSAALLILLPTRYIAEATLMPPRQVPSAVAMLSQMGASEGASSLAAMAGAGLALKNPNDIYISMLESRPVADAIISEFDLSKVYGKSIMSDVRKKLANRTVIESGKDGLISIAVTDADKKLATDIANAYVEQLKKLSKQLSTTEADRRARFFEDQLATSREQLTEAEVAFQRTQQSKGLVQLEAQGKAAIEGLARLREGIAAKEVEVQSLQSIATEHNPRLEMAKRELDALRGQEAELDRGESEPGSTDFHLKDLPASGLDYLRAQRELQYEQAIYGILLKQFEAAKLDESKDAVTIQVLEPAIVPDRKSFPRPTMTLGLGAAAGFLFGCFWIYMQDELRRTPLLAAQLRSFLQSLCQWS